MVVEPHDLPVESSAEPVVTVSLTEVEFSPEPVADLPPSSEEIAEEAYAAPVEVH